jgi:hypothetical protein
LQVRTLKAKKKRARKEERIGKRRTRRRLTRSSEKN